MVTGQRRRPTRDRASPSSAWAGPSASAISWSPRSLSPRGSPSSRTTCPSSGVWPDWRPRTRAGTIGL